VGDLARLEQVALDVAQASEALGVKPKPGEDAGEAAHRTAWEEETALLNPGLADLRGLARGEPLPGSDRRRALHKIACANGERARLLRRIDRTWGQSIEWHIREAERERDEMVRLVGELTMAKAAE
jgi:hypothetical protein